MFVVCICCRLTTVYYVALVAVTSNWCVLYAMYFIRYVVESLIALVIYIVTNSLYFLNR